MRIANREMGKNCPCFIVAEAGINHNGDLETAKNMIDVAKECGVDAIKFQTFKAKEFVSDKNETYTYVSRGRSRTESMFEMFQRYEFASEEFKELSRYCHEKSIIFFSSPQNISDLELLLKIGIPAIKVGSDDLTNIPLLENYASRKLPVIISTGMSYLHEVAESVTAIEKITDEIVILLCVSSYPADFLEVNLNRIHTLKTAFPGKIVGYSDHTLGISTAIGAVTLGANVIEKHFTMDRNLPGPDHHFSADPEELCMLVREIRNIEAALGSSDLKPSLKEEEMRLLCRRSAVASNDIRKGAIINESDIAIKRPGSGIPPKNLNYIIGRKAKQIIKKDMPISIVDLI